METNPLPFEHSALDLSHELLGRMGHNSMASFELNAWFNGHVERGVDTPEQLLKITETIKHGGGIRMLLSFVANGHPFIEKLPDNQVRGALYRSAEETATRYKVTIAELELGISDSANAADHSAYAKDMVVELGRFQEKLLQRVTPSDPQTRK